MKNRISVMAFAFWRGLIASSFFKVILRTSLREAAYGATLLVIIAQRGAEERKKLKSQQDKTAE